MAKAPTSYIKTATAAATRQKDVISLPFDARPQPMTLYCRFLDLGAFVGRDDGKIVAISSTGADTFLLDIDADPAPHYRIGASNGVTYRVAQFSTAAIPPHGATVELCANWNANGSVSGYLSINGGTPSTVAATTALTRTQAFSSPKIAFGHWASSYQTPVAIRDVLVVRGVHDLNTMRKRAGLL